MKAVIALLALAIASPVAAKTTFAAYEGPDAEQVGKGGTRVDMKGIDLWTTGTPPRRYKVLGIIEDQRKDRMLDGDPTSSPAIAKLARASGGDAILLLGQDSEAAGFVGTGNAYSSGASTFGSVQGRAVNRRTTRFAVIRYLE